MRILVEGSGLSGREALVESLAAVYRDAGYVVRTNRGGFHKGLAHRFMNSKKTISRMEAGLVSWLLCLQYICDFIAYLVAPTTRQVWIQESYVDHSIAFAEAFHHSVAAAVLRGLSKLLPGFDAYVFVTSSHLEKVRRYLRSTKRDAVDRLVLTEPDLSLAIERGLERRLAEKGAVSIETDGMTTFDTLQAACCHIDRLTTAPKAVFLRHAA